MKMETPKLDISKIWTDVNRLAEPGVTGFHTHFEVTEIFVLFAKGGPAYNVFTLLVAEDRTGSPDQPSKYLGDRIRLKLFKEPMFGIKRSYITIQELEGVIERLKTTGDWRIGDQKLLTGKLAPLDFQFVVPDSTSPVQLNNVLKNNFWNGSHVVELMDVSKEYLGPLLDFPARLQELSEAIQKRLPIRLASLSDRLGNIVIQLPVTVLVTAFARNRITGETTVTTRWHPKASPRPLRATVEMRFDGVVTTHGSAELWQPQGVLPTTDGEGLQETALWDDQNGVLLARSGATAFIETIGLGMHILGGEPRVFALHKQDGQTEQVRIGMVNAMQNEVKAPKADRGRNWIQRRIYRQETSNLMAQRRFVPYKPEPGKQDEMHQKALSDIRALINQYGRGGVWLWDPYLGADDIIRTLFYCPYIGADMRALTAGYERPSGVRVQSTFAFIWKQLVALVKEKCGNAPAPEPSFADRQRHTFAAADSNLYGLQLEYRMKSGTKGWAFHDRFLIFPDTNEGSLAWSLGTSVNALGRQHHIFQRVDDSRHVVDAFLELWNQLDGSDQLIWKAP
jgi:hypothetical protein